MTIYSALQQIFSMWAVEKNKPFRQNSLVSFITKDFKREISSRVHPKFADLKVDASAGQGNWADVPWLSFLNPKITQTTSDGIYPAYLFGADGSGVYLTLMFGTEVPQENLGKMEAQERFAVIAYFLLHKVVGLAGWSNAEINLKSSARRARSYESAKIAWKFYPADNLPNEEVLLGDLAEILDVYAQVEPIWLKEFSTFTISDEIREIFMKRQAVSSLAESMGGQISVQNPEQSLSKKMTDLMRQIHLPKPFLLLGGISGTGKSRFIREQAKMVDPTLKNFLSIPVRPDWHEPSDLMGYVSRINGEEYVATDFLKFIVKAWRAAIVSATQDGFQLKALAEISTYWLCLDEMNLAPVEQYFADYLSVSETRCWEGETYSCDALLKPEVLAGLGEGCRVKLALSLWGCTPEENGLWDYFLAHGIALPPNLVVAGTVNMDETTHSFSRKVIDRAFTLDFGEFYSNDFDAFFEPTTRNKGLAFSRHSHASLSALAAIPADPNGAKSIAFFKAIHAVLQDTPFELAFRALNELLIAVICYAPSSDETLQAVWDDYLMGKLLPRLDGDRDKLRPRQSNPNAGEEVSLLSELAAVLQTQMSLVWERTRVDLLREQLDDAASPILVACRSRKKIDWMQARLTNYGFTSFWP